MSCTGLSRSVSKVLLTAVLWCPLNASECGGLALIVKAISMKEPEACTVKEIKLLQVRPARSRRSSCYR